MRRLSGTLLLPMVLHGLWDSSLFLSDAARRRRLTYFDVLLNIAP